MAEACKINFYPKPAPPTNPRIKSFEEIQRLLAQAPAPPTHKRLNIDGPKKASIQCTNRGANQFR